MEAKLFLDGIFSSGSNSPSSIKIKMPNSGNSNYNSSEDIIIGLMTGDVSFSAQNSWGTVISDLTNLQDLGALLGSSNLISWISASTMCWKGTAPLSIGVDFYLINYKKNLKPSLEDQLRKFVRLAALDNVGDSTASSFMVQVHGGYAPDIFKNNNEQFFTLGKVKSATQLGSLQFDTSNIFNANNSNVGAVELQFGHKSKIKNLLLSKVSVTESNIEVADQNGNNIKPLYYKVSAQFTGVRPLITTDVDYMFNF